MRPGTANSAAAPGGPGLGTVTEAAERGLTLPPYLLGLQARGCPRRTGSPGGEFVRTVVAGAVARADGTVAEIAAELAARPETFTGRAARSPSGGEGRGWFDVTVTISPATDERPPEIRAGRPRAGPGGRHQGRRPPQLGRRGGFQFGRLDEVTARAGPSSGSRPSRRACTWAAWAWRRPSPGQSSLGEPQPEGVAEPRVLRGESGVGRGTARGALRRTDQAAGRGTRTARNEHRHADHAGADRDLVPYDTAAPPPVPRVDRPGAGQARPAGRFPRPGRRHRRRRAARRRRRAVRRGRLRAAPLAHRARLPRAGPPVRGDLHHGRAGGHAPAAGQRRRERRPDRAGPRTAGAYRMSARIAGLAPGWAAGQTQLRTHAHAHTRPPTRRARGAPVRSARDRPSVSAWP
ncbi:hypothetical protein LV779_37085 [Streptomyces thinghirensis]|nr:hypothetical protein [Streptomyces thinghirensis]